MSCPSTLRTTLFSIKVSPSELSESHPLFQFHSPHPNAKDPLWTNLFQHLRFECLCFSFFASHWDSYFSILTHHGRTVHPECFWITQYLAAKSAPECRVQLLHVQLLQHGCSWTSVLAQPFWILQNCDLFFRRFGPKRRIAMGIWSDNAKRNHCCKLVDHVHSLVRPGHLWHLQFEASCLLFNSLHFYWAQLVFFWLCGEPWPRCFVLSGESTDAPSRLWTVAL